MSNADLFCATLRLPWSEAESPAGGDDEGKGAQRVEAVSWPSKLSQTVLNKGLQHRYNNTTQHKSRLQTWSKADRMLGSQQPPRPVPRAADAGEHPRADAAGDGREG